MHFNTKHGFHGTPTYHVWRGLRSRCDNPNSPAYSYYGGRGITYDPRWDKFENFLADMGEKPEGRSLDRIDPDGNYCKENCRWATDIEQQRNRRTHHWVTVSGEKMPLSVACEKLGLSYHTVAKRLEGGMPEDQALSLPVAKKDWTVYTFDGMSMRIGEWLKYVGIPYSVYSGRRKKGMSVEEAVFTEWLPSGNVERFKINGLWMTVPQIEQTFQIPSTTFRNRMVRGMTPDEAVTLPIREKRGTRVELQGVKKSVREWAKEYGVLYSDVRALIKNGRTLERALTEAPRNKS